MKDQNLLKKVNSLSVGDLSSYFHDNGIKEAKIESILKDNLEEDKMSNLQWKVQEAFKRITAPLDTGVKILYFFIPFGKFISFTEEGPKYSENGYFRREKEFLKYSWLGICFYVVVAFIVKAIFG